MSRREQLAHALKDARRQHAGNGSRGSFDRVKAAANTLKQWVERFDALTEERRKAAMLFREDEVARIDKLITKHNTPDGDITDVKLVDTAGTLRLDLNGRRTFMNREQALGLFLRLGNTLASPNALDGYHYTGSQVECAMDAICLAAHAMRIEQ